MRNGLTAASAGRRPPPRARCLALFAAFLLAGGPLTAGDDDAVTPPTTVVEFARFMRDSRTVLVGRGNGDIEVRVAPDGKKTETLRAPEETDTLEVSPDGWTIVASHVGLRGATELRVWDTANWKPLRPIRVDGKRLFGTAFSPTGDLMAFGARADTPTALDNTIVIWDVKKHTVRTFLHGDTNAANHLAFSPSKPLLACAAGCGGLGGFGQWVDVWDTDAWHRGALRGVQGNSLGVACLAFLPDGERIATGGVDKAIRVFDCYSHEELQTLRGHESTICALVPLPGDRIISGACDHTIRLWDLTTGREVARLRVGDWVHRLDLSPDGKTLVSVGLSVGEDKIRFWDVPSLLRTRGDAKPEECEKWRGEWKSAPSQEPGVRVRSEMKTGLPRPTGSPKGRDGRTRQAAAERQELEQALDWIHRQQAKESGWDLDQLKRGPQGEGGPSHISAPPEPSEFVPTFVQPLWGRRGFGSRVP